MLSLELYLFSNEVVILIIVLFRKQSDERILSRLIDLISDVKNSDFDTYFSRVANSTKIFTLGLILSATCFKFIISNFLVFKSLLVMAYMQF